MTEEPTGAEFEPSAYDTTIRRTVAAPRERVFEDWTDPEQLKLWWGPHGVTTPVCELDVRPDGAIHVEMHGPDGTVYSIDRVFHEVVEPERLAFTSRPFEDDDGDPRLEVHNTVTVADRDGSTELAVEATVVTETPDITGPLEGTEAGWGQSFEKLALRLENEDQ